MGLWYKWIILEIASLFQEAINVSSRLQCLWQKENLTHFATADEADASKFGRAISRFAGSGNMPSTAHYAKSAFLGMWTLG